MIGLTVRDIQSSLRFYRLLGLDTPDIPDGEDYAEVITPNGYRISWNSLKLVKELYPGWEEHPVGQRIGLAFKCARPAEVDSLYNEVVRQGYGSHKAPWDAFWGQRYAVVIDPDGNLVDLFAPLEGEPQPS
jgi:catechol 2,3-dioxygenase-like lactoylglutathione lyase family enzyme